MERKSDQYTMTKEWQNRLRELQKNPPKLEVGRAAGDPKLVQQCRESVLKHLMKIDVGKTFYFEDVYEDVRKDFPRASNSNHFFQAVTSYIVLAKAARSSRTVR